MAAYAYVSDGEGQNAELAAYGYDSNIDTLTTQLLDGIKNTRSLSLFSGSARVSILHLHISFFFQFLVDFMFSLLIIITDSNLYLFEAYKLCI